jgi:hypothetical protein
VLLLVVAAVLQGLDWSSTLMSTAGQSETNPLLLGLARGLSLHGALALIKVAGSVVLAGLAYAWTRTRGRYDAEFITCLTVLTSVYAVVVLTNFLDR